MLQYRAVVQHSSDSPEAGRVDEGIKRPSGPTGRNLAASTTPGIPVRLEALLSTFLTDDTQAQPFAGP